MRQYRLIARNAEGEEIVYEPSKRIRRILQDDRRAISILWWERFNLFVTMPPSFIVQRWELWDGLRPVVWQACRYGPNLWFPTYPELEETWTSSGS